MCLLRCVTFKCSRQKRIFETREGNKTIRQADSKELHVMDFDCNVTTLKSQTQINSTVFHQVKMVSMCVSCTLNTVLSVPLLLVIPRSPSLLRHTRFLLLTHLLLCDNLQQLLWTITAVLLRSREGIPVTQCLISCAVIQACSLVDLFLSTALAVDRFIAVKWPLRYESLMGRRRKRAVAAIWTSAVVLIGVALCINLSTIQVNFTLPRCRPLIMSPCLSRMSALVLYCTVGTAVLVPLCFLTILGCFCRLCWDIHAGLPCTRRACVTLSLQVAQAILFSVPVVTNSYLIPGYLHSDALDIATTISYNLGVSLIPLVYGYRSRELQQQILQAAHWNKVNNQSLS